MSKKPDDTPSTEVVIAEVVETALAEAAREGDVISTYLRTEVENVDVPDGAAHKAIIDEIMRSATLDDLLGAPEAEEPKKFVGRRLLVEGFSANDSEYTTGPKVYFSVRAKDLDTGTRHIITIGEQAVMAQLLVMEREGWFPLQCTIMEGARPNRYGRYPMRFVRVDD